MNEGGLFRTSPSRRDTETEMTLDEVWPARPRAERKYRRAADSIVQLLAAGRELLDERGLAPGLGRVTLNDAIERSGIPRSSAYRLYQGGDGPLESYRVALLSDVTEDFVSTAERFEALESILVASRTKVDEPDPRALGAALREVIRVGIDANVMTWAKSTEWQAVSSAIIASASDGEANVADREMLTAGILRLVRGVLPLYRDMARLGGLRLRDGVDWDEFARVTSAAVEGVAIRHVVDPDLLAISRPTGSQGEQQRWGAAAIIFEALFVSYFTADPEAAVSADLSCWHR